MKLILIFLLFHLLLSQNETNKNEMYTYPYLSTQFYFQYTQNIIFFQGKTEKIKCYATKDIKVNDTLFVYEENEIISNINILLPELDKITSIVKSNIKDIYIQNKFLLSIFIYHVLTNPAIKIPQYNEKLRLFILHFPFNEIYPIELFVERNNIEEFLINKEWVKYKDNEEKKLMDIIGEKCLDINITNKNDENYILFGKVYYFVKLYSFNVDGNAVILPFFDRCNVNPYYLHKNQLNYDSIFLEKNKGDIIVKSKVNIMQRDQFSFAYEYPLSNDYLLLTQGKVVFNNINDKYFINKNFSFENNNELGSSCFLISSACFFFKDSISKIFLIFGLSGSFLMFLFSISFLPPIVLFILLSIIIYIVFYLLLRISLFVLLELFLVLFSLYSFIILFDFNLSKALIRVFLKIIFLGFIT